MARWTTAILLAIGLVFAVQVSAAAAGGSGTQTLVFDAVATGSFVDKPPTGPSVGDIEHDAAKLVDSHGRRVGTARSTCVFTKKTKDDVVERCTSFAKTAEGTVSLSGRGYLYSMNPPWQVKGLSGAYKGLRGTQIFSTDIALDPGVPVAAGRGFSVVVIKVKSRHPLKIGAVPRPPANAGFIRRANSACHATEKKVQQFGDFPFPDFDPFHPDPQTLPQVGQWLGQPGRRALPSKLLQSLTRLGKPAASRAAWRDVLGARQTLAKGEDDQIDAALANNSPAFVKTVYQTAREYNQLVFRSAVFGVQSCTFG